MLRPFQVVLLFLVLNVSKDHESRQYISISVTATNPSQSDSLRTLNLSLKYSHVISRVQYLSYQGLIDSKGEDVMQLLYSLTYSKNSNVEV